MKIATQGEEASATQVTTMGIDLAKNVFQLHGIDAANKVVLRKALRRSQVLPFFEDLAPCLIGMEACSSAHHCLSSSVKCNTPEPI